MDLTSPSLEQCTNQAGILLDMLQVGDVIEIFLHDV